MAIQKAIEQPQGTTFAYWRVSRFTLDRINQYAEFFLHGYLTKADFEAGKSHFPSRRFAFEGADFAALIGAGNVTLGAKEIVKQAEILFKAKVDADPQDSMTGGVREDDTGL